MSGKKPIPNEPLAFIKECFHARKVYWTYHINLRLEQRLLSRKVVFDAMKRSEIIESYPDDKYFPSYLLLSENVGLRFHLLIAVDVLGDNVRVVTAYVPDPNEWDKDLKKRKKLL